MALDADQMKCGGISLAGFLVVVVGTAMIAVSVTSIDFERTSSHDEPSSSCLVEPRIPFYLLAGGILVIVLLVLRFVLQRWCRNCGGDGCAGNKLCNTISHVCAFSCITCYDLMAVLIQTALLIVATVWIVNVWDEVSYNSRSASYCPMYVYLFSVACIVAGWIFVAFVLVCGLLCRFFSFVFDFICCKPCKEAEANRAV